MRNSQTEGEIEVFRAFAEAAAPGIDLATIETRRPPEPDILCLDSNQGLRAFELVELLDNDYARRVGQLFGTKSALYAFIEKLPAEERAAFEARFHNALLYFRYTDRSTLNQRRSSLPRVFEKLAALPEDFAGDALENDPEFSGLLKGVSVSRGRFQGPILDPESGGWIGDPTIPNIAAKFGKKYEAVCPVELLAYVDGNPMFPDEVWLANLVEHLESEPKPFTFKRVWVFDLRSKTVKLSCDEMARPLTSRSSGKSVV